jgi:hypothetical protein
MEQQIGYAIVGDGKDGWKFFGDTFTDQDDHMDWVSIGYRAVPVYVDMDDEMKEFYFY